MQNGRYDDLDNATELADYILKNDSYVKNSLDVTVWKPYDDAILLAMAVKDLVDKCIHLQQRLTKAGIE